MATSELERSSSQADVSPETSARELLEKTPPHQLEITAIQPLLDGYKETMTWLKKHPGVYTFQVEVEDEDGQKRLEDASAKIGAGVLIRRMCQPPEENEFNFQANGNDMYASAVQRVYFDERPEVTMRGKVGVRGSICRLENLGFLEDGLHTLNDIRSRIEFPPLTTTTVTTV